MIETVVLGTAEYQWALRPFSYLFRKFWPNQHIIWYGDRVTEPIPHGIEFRRVPCYSEGIWPWEPWFSNGLRSVLDDLDGFIVALFLPDHWLSGPVGVEAVNALHDWMDRKGNVMRGELTAGTCLEIYGEHVATVAGHEIVSVRPDHAHCGLGGGITFSPALWNRALLRDLLEPAWNLWQTESLGTRRMVKRAPEIYSVGMRPFPLQRCHGLRHAQPQTANLDTLEPEDAEIVRGMLPKGWNIA